MKGILYLVDYHSPIGRLMLGATDEGLAICALKEVADKRQIVEKTIKTFGLKTENSETNGVLALTTEWLDNYFAGQKNEKRLPLMMGGSPFQKKVWMELLEIPYGSTVSYGSLADKVGNPRAVRAVAGAVGANRLWIVVPCHRVIGADGSLTGYAGGLDAKRFLLSLESRG